ncbi:transposase, partial [Spirulina subsalsa FACHB-351]
MAHSQKSIKDHTRQRTQPNLDSEAIAQQLEDLIKPCVYSQLAYYRSFGMRERILSLPFMMAVVLTIIEAQSDWITRYKQGAKYEVIKTLSHSFSHRDQIIRLGKGYKGNPILSVRLVEIRHGSSWYRYVTSVVDPERLPPYVVGDLYNRRWTIETTFHTLKRLLGLSYLWTGSINGIKLQLWATWIFYVVLIDL